MQTSQNDLDCCNHTTVCVRRPTANRTLLPESTITHSIREKIMIRQKRQGTFVVMVQPCKPMQGK